MLLTYPVNMLLALTVNKSPRQHAINTNTAYAVNNDTGCKQASNDFKQTINTDTEPVNMPLTTNICYSCCQYSVNMPLMLSQSL